MKYRYLYTDPKSSEKNSVTNSVSEDLDLMTFLRKGGLTQLEDRTIEHLTNVIRGWHKYYVTNIPLQSLNTKERNMLGDIQTTNDIDPIVKEDYGKKYIGYTEEHSRGRLFRKNLKLMINPKIEKMTWKKQQDTQIERLIIRKYHPSSEFRTFINSIIQLEQDGCAINKLTIGELVEMRRELKGDFDMIDNAWSKSMKAAIRAIAYAALCGNYRMGLQHILSKLTGKKENRNYINKQVELYRKLGSLYMRWRPEIIISMETIKFMEEMTAEKKNIKKVRHEEGYVESDKGLISRYSESAEKALNAFYEEFARNLLTLDLSNNIIYNDDITSNIQNLGDIGISTNVDTDNIGRIISNAFNFDVMADELNEIGKGETTMEKLGQLFNDDVMMDASDEDEAFGAFNTL